MPPLSIDEGKETQHRQCPAPADQVLRMKVPVYEDPNDDDELVDKVLYPKEGHPLSHLSEQKSAWKSSTVYRVFGL